MVPVDPVPITGDAPLELVAKGVRKVFGHNVVLDGVDLEVRRGELVAIVGRSGCGKSVLVECLTGRLPTDGGSILVADHERKDDALVDLADLDEDGMDALRRHWSIVFQRNALFSGTVRENVALWLQEVARLRPAEIEERVRAAVTRVGLDPERVLDTPRDELSGGMAKRVAIARAVAMRPRLMIYDEPTTGLDPQYAALIHDLIRDVHAETDPAGGRRTTVLVTHDTTLLRRLRPRIVMIHAGRVHFDGDAAEFTASTDPEIRPYLNAMAGLQGR